MKCKVDNAPYGSQANDDWKRGDGVIVLQVSNDTDDYLSLCRENYVIKAAGNHLTNFANGLLYWFMKEKWTVQEVKFFGEEKKSKF